MKLLYGEDKFFIGAVKFYDEIKPTIYNLF